MPGPFLSCKGLVLGRSESGEHHWRLEIFSPEEGAVQALARRSSKSRPRATIPDLFEAVVVELEKASRGKVYFVKEAQAEAPFAAIARDYHAFLEAGSFTRTVWKNLVHAESFAEPYALTARALAAFARGIRPEVTHFKSLYLLARLEGYPVKEQMLASWSPTDRALARKLLTEPLEGDQPSDEKASELLASLQQYLRGHTDIVI